MPGIVSSKFHTLLDLLSNLMKMIAAMRMTECQSYREQAGTRAREDAPRRVAPVLAAPRASRCRRAACK